VFELPLLWATLARDAVESGVGCKYSEFVYFPVALSRASISGNPLSDFWIDERGFSILPSPCHDQALTDRLMRLNAALAAG
jgi:hypothetical protein